MGVPALDELAEGFPLAILEFSTSVSTYVLDRVGAFLIRPPGVEGRRLEGDDIGIKLALVARGELEGSTCADGRRGLASGILSTSLLILLGIMLGDRPSCNSPGEAKPPEGRLRSAGLLDNPADLGLRKTSVSPLVLGVIGNAVTPAPIPPVTLLLLLYLDAEPASTISLGLLVLARGVDPPERGSWVAGELTLRMPKEGEPEYGLEGGSNLEAEGGGVVGKWEGREGTRFREGDTGIRDGPACMLGGADSV